MNTDHYPTAIGVYRDEIAALERTLERNRTAFNATVNQLLNSQGKVVITGLGKSGLIGHKIAATFASTGTPVSVGVSQSLGMNCAGRRRFRHAPGRSGPRRPRHGIPR